MLNLVRKLGTAISRETRDLEPQDLIWIFGSERTGSTWLGRMLGEMRGQVLWDEPLIGMLFGDFQHRIGVHHAQKRAHEFVFGDAYKHAWLESVADFVLKQASVRFPRANQIVIKEPNGSVGACLLSEALPKSRFILLVRDPRDAVASSLVSHSKGGWLRQWAGDAGEAWGADDDPDAFVANRARFYAANVSNAMIAFDAHPGPKILLRYEDLHADTLGEMRKLYTVLELPIDKKELARTVEHHAWKNIPENEKGEGRFNRRGETDSWREELTNGQARTVERITAPLIERFYNY